MSRKSRNIPLKEGKKYAFVVDGECEMWYLHMLKKNENIRAEFSPEVHHKKSLSEQFSRVEELAKDYPKVFWIIDLDVPIRNTRAGSDKIAELKTYLDKLNKADSPNKVIVIINIPGLEFWYLLHFQQTARYYDTCKKVETKLKKEAVLSGYDKTEKYYKQVNNDIYSRLKDFLPTAIRNAAKLPQLNLDNCEVGLSEMDELFYHIEELSKYRV